MFPPPSALSTCTIWLESVSQNKTMDFHKIFRICSAQKDQELIMFLYLIHCTMATLFYDVSGLSCLSMAFLFKFDGA